MDDGKDLKALVVGKDANCLLAKYGVVITMIIDWVSCWLPPPSNRIHGSLKVFRDPLQKMQESWW